LTGARLLRGGSRSLALRRQLTRRTDARQSGAEALPFPGVCARCSGLAALPAPGRGVAKDDPSPPPSD